jgi:hypothetical protein
MGMLEYKMKGIPERLLAEGKTPEVYCREINERLTGLFHIPGEAAPESASATILKPEQFEQAWEDQDNLIRNDTVKEKYRKWTAEGRVIWVEIDW